MGIRSSWNPFVFDRLMCGLSHHLAANCWVSTCSNCWVLSIFFVIVTMSLFNSSCRSLQIKGYGTPSSTVSSGLTWVTAPCYPRSSHCPECWEATRFDWETERDRVVSPFSSLPYPLLRQKFGIVEIHESSSQLKRNLLHLLRSSLVSEHITSNVISHDKSLK